MKISEIFFSTNGEGKFSGLNSVFIRTFGCPLKCSWCDSMYAVEDGQYKDMTIGEILDYIKRYRCKRVTLTGGEPVIQETANDLINALTARGYHVELETCGAVPIDSYTVPEYSERVESQKDVTSIAHTI